MNVVWRNEWINDYGSERGLYRLPEWTRTYSHFRLDEYLFVGRESLFSKYASTLETEKC